METFVIRVWRDDNDAWQGKVIHLPEQDACFFIAWSEAVIFMRQQSGWSAQGVADDRNTGPPDERAC
jgi:hypothetical protein